MISIKELVIAFVLYLVTMSVVWIAVYRFVESWQLHGLNMFVVGVLFLLLAVGWGYILSSMLFASKQKIQKSVTTVVDETLHELNIPLSTIHANTTMLKKVLQDEKSLQRIQRIEDASLRLRRLYDTLSYTLHKEIHRIEKETFSVKALIEERVKNFELQARHVFEMKLEEIMIHADKIGFEQIIDNILYNAMKYSPKHETIEISLTQKKLCIKDRGVGMNTADLLRIYEHYFQANETIEGNGIGLALVKKYCDSENIEISITSDEGKGTMIRLDLEQIHS